MQVNYCSSNVLNILTVIGTFLAIIVSLILAIFGEYLKNCFIRPRLAISLSNEHGELTRLSNGKDALFFHLTVKNFGRTKANNVQLILKKVEIQRKEGYRINIHESKVPFLWMFFEWDPRGIYKTIGAKQEEKCDLLSLSNESFSPCLLFKPNNFPEIWAKDTEYVFTLYAKSDETYSEDYEVKFSWDGEWCQGIREMKDHYFLCFDKVVQPKRKSGRQKRGCYERKPI